MENQITWLLVLTLPFMFFIFLIFKHFFLSHQSNAINNSAPTPPSLPVIGHLHLIKNPLHLSLASLSSRYGPILSLRLGCKSFLLLSSPSAVEECFTENDIVFANRPTSVAGDHLTYHYADYSWSSHGDLWRIYRRLTVVEIFSSNSLQKSAEIREQEILQLVRVLRRHAGKKVDMSELICSYSFNIAMRAIAGERCVGETEIGSEKGKETLNRIRGIFAPAVMLGMCDYFPILRWIGYKGLEKNAILMHEKRDEFLQSLIDQIRMKMAAAAVAERKSNLIETLLSVQASEPDLYNDDVIKGILVVMLTAGTDTSAVTLEWAMSSLLTQPDELQKLRQEIDDNIEHDHVINESDLPRLPYLRCIVNETLRLHPAAPLLLPHISSQECMVGGYNIPKGTILMVNAWAIQRDPNHWDEPEMFDPERFWGAETEKELGHKFLPFGIGRRACPGVAMALRTVSLALGAFVQCFEWEKPIENDEVDFEANLGVTLHKEKPLEAVCIVRKEAANLLSHKA